MLTMDKRFILAGLEYGLNSKGMTYVGRTSCITAFLIN
ncbi:hypothetical protein yfred0001_10600 [Yersinia frederiksenii ATCC 33641]|nr:hypothetical protein yfred0001_10600 [Yersinia frederiksenii ATCC 33641]